MQCPTCLAENPDAALSCNACGTPLSTQEATYHLPAGILLKQGKYRVDKTLGEGGFGITYRGVDTSTSQEIALKELLPEKSIRQGTVFVWHHQITPQQRQKQIQEFKREAEFLSRCHHPNIVRVYDWFEENATAYIVMDFISGKSLYDLYKAEKPLPESRIKHYFIQVAEALKVLHANNLLHRDIKPENIIINPQDQALLIDFGNAREFVAGQTSNMTQTLTKGYAPIEQYGQKSKRGPSTDFYAVCASMYELITGQLPPDATDRMQSDTLVAPSQLGARIDPLLEQIIMSGLKMKAAERFQTADELIDALKGKFVSPNLRKARQLVTQEKLLEAVSAYEQCLQEPNAGEASVELALVQMHLNDSQAEASAQRAIQLQPHDGRGYGVLGLVNCRRSKWADALQQLQKAAQLAPQEPWIQANLAWALGKSGNWQQAGIAVEKSLQQDSNLVFALGLKAWISAHQQQWKTTIPAARQALFKSKQTHAQDSKTLQQWVYPCLAIALDKALITKNAPDLERCLQEFIAQVPDSAFAWGFNAYKQASKGLWNDAITSFEEATRRTNVQAWILKNQGIAYEHSKNVQKAINLYELAYQKAPNDPLILFRLGTLLGQQKQWMTAQTHLEKAIQLKPDYAEAHHNLGWVLLNLRKQDQQAKNFRQIRSAYSQAVSLYTQQSKSTLAQAIQQAFYTSGVEL